MTVLRREVITSSNLKLCYEFGCQDEPVESGLVENTARLQEWHLVPFDRLRAGWLNMTVFYINLKLRYYDMYSRVIEIAKIITNSPWFPSTGSGQAGSP